MKEKCAGWRAGWLAGRGLVFPGVDMLTFFCGIE